MCVTANSLDSCPITADAERPSKRHKGRAQDAPQVVVLDIEGTVAPISFVYDIMFPYAKKKLQSYLEKNWDTAEMRSEVQQLRAEVCFCQILAVHFTFTAIACSTCQLRMQCCMLCSQHAVGKIDIRGNGWFLSSVHPCYRRHLKAMCMCRQS